MPDLTALWDKHSANIILAFAVFATFVIVSYIISAILNSISKRVNTNKSEIYQLIASSQKTILIIIGIISALGTLGINISALVAGLGLTGFALGLALKDAVSNLVAGIMIVFYQPFELGDQIELAGVKGEVTAINLRYITIKTEQSDYLIPNSMFLNNKIGLKHIAQKSL